MRALKTLYANLMSEVHFRRLLAPLRCSGGAEIAWNVFSFVTNTFVYMFVFYSKLGEGERRVAWRRNLLLVTTRWSWSKMRGRSRPSSKRSRHGLKRASASRTERCCRTSRRTCNLQTASFGQPAASANICDDTYTVLVCSTMYPSRLSM